MMPDDSLLAQNAPRSSWRGGRVALLAEASAALLRGEAPSQEACMFLGSALSAWLSSGDRSLEKHLRVTPPAGSHHRHDVLYRRFLEEERQRSDAALSCEVSTNEGNEP